MITAQPQTPWEAMVAQWAQNVAQTATARAELDARNAANDPTAWRQARLLWPDVSSTSRSKG